MRLRLRQRIYILCVWQYIYKPPKAPYIERLHAGRKVRPAHGLQCSTAQAFALPTTPAIHQPRGRATSTGNTERSKNFTACFTFCEVNYIYYMGSTYNGSCTNIITNNTNTMHRVYRNDMQQAQKDKIAAANTGKKLSQQTKDKISRSMQKYWAQLPYKPESSTQTPPPANNS